MVTRPGDLRFRAWTCPLLIYASKGDAHRVADPRHGAGNLPRLCSFRHRPVPMHEHSGPLLDRIPERHRGASPVFTRGVAAWMEVVLASEWHMFAPRNNKPRFAGILIARGRDASDVPLTQTSGENT